MNSNIPSFNEKNPYKQKRFKPKSYCNTNSIVELSKHLRKTETSIKLLDWINRKQN